MLPLHTAVKIVNEESVRCGETAFVLTQPGNRTNGGAYVPPGWYELALGPWENGFQTMLFREEHIEICGC